MAYLFGYGPPECTLTMHAITAMLFLLLVGTAQAATPTLPGGITVTPGTKGTAPFCVHFDASHAVDADEGNKAFINLDHAWTFGDPNSGTWAYGASATASKTFANGPVAVHCYETAGIYTVNHSLTDGTTIVSNTATITVVAASTIWNEANTTCFYRTTHYGSCPDGGSETQRSDGDFAAALATCLNGSAKRCLFRGGETWVHSAVTNTGALTDIYIGSYGKGKVIVNKADNVKMFEVTSEMAARWKFVELDIRANTTDRRSVVLNVAAGINAADFVVLRVDVFQTQMVGQTGSIAPPVTAGSWNNLVIQDSTQRNHYGGNSFFGALIKGALLGSQWGPAGGGTAEHIVRLQGARRTVVSNNTFYSAHDGKHLLTVRGQIHQTGAAEDPAHDTYFVVVSGNRFDNRINPRSAWIVQAAPSGSTQCQWGRDIIFERNYVLYGNGSANQRGFITEFKRVAIRNNVFDLSQLKGSYAATVVSLRNGQEKISNPYCHGSNVDATNTLPTPTDNMVANNTIYYAGDAAIYAVAIDSSGATDVTNTTVINNLAYAPHSTGNQRMTHITKGRAAGTRTITSSTPDSGTNEIKDASPGFQGTTELRPQQFRPTGTRGYPVEGGIAIVTTTYDFGNCRDKNGYVRKGAWVPRANAECRGMARP